MKKLRFNLSGLLEGHVAVKSWRWVFCGNRNSTLIAMPRLSKALRVMTLHDLHEGISK